MKNQWNQEYTYGLQFEQISPGYNFLESKDHILVVFFSSQPVEGTHLLIEVTTFASRVDVAIIPLIQQNIQWWCEKEHSVVVTIRDPGPQMPKLKTSSAIN